MYTTNPQTGRRIKVNGDTYRRVFKSQSGAGLVKVNIKTLKGVSQLFDFDNLTDISEIIIQATQEHAEVKTWSTSRCAKIDLICNGIILESDKKLSDYPELFTSVGVAVVHVVCKLKTKQYVEEKEYGHIDVLNSHPKLSDKDIFIIPEIVEMLRKDEYIISIAFNNISQPEHPSVRFVRHIVVVTNYGTIIRGCLSEDKTPPYQGKPYGDGFICIVGSNKLHYDTIDVIKYIFDIGLIDPYRIAKMPRPLNGSEPNIPFKNLFPEMYKGKYNEFPPEKRHQIYQFDSKIMEKITEKMGVRFPDGIDVRITSIMGLCSIIHKINQFMLKINHK